MRFYFTIAMLLVFCVLGSAQDNAGFERGNTAYKQKNYTTAVAEYSKIVEAGLHSPELFHNLGTAYFKTGKLGDAILYLEKAHRLDPSDKNIRKNLTQARDEVDTPVVEIPDFILLRIWKTFSGLFSPLVWLIIQLLSGLLMVFGIYRWRMGQESSIKVRGFAMMLSGLALMIVSLIAGKSSHTQLTDNNTGIIMTATTLYESADNRSNEIEPLSEGVKVRVIDIVDNWYQVTLMNKAKGWILDEHVERI